MRLRPSIIAFRTSPDERWLLVRCGQTAGETVSELGAPRALQGRDDYTVEVPAEAPSRRGRPMLTVTGCWSNRREMLLERAAERECELNEIEQAELTR